MQLCLINVHKVTVCVFLPVYRKRLSKKKNIDNNVFVREGSDYRPEY